jgi:hypothetical protein
MRLLVRILGLLVLAWFQAPPAPAQTPEAAGLAWPELVARDGRVSFSMHSAPAAFELLQAENVSKERRAAAWLTLGAAGAAQHLQALLDCARTGPDPERGAAILALGELGQGGDSVLLELSAGSDAALAERALLALLLTHNPVLRRRVEELAGQPGQPLAPVAAVLLVFAADPQHSEASASARALLELRWRAAQEFGLVDGQTWPVLVYRALGQRAEFRNEVVLRAAARLDRPLVHDLLLGALLQGEGGPGRLRGAARGIPRELALLVQNGLWKPADVGEWTLLFDELEDSHLEPFAVELYDAALADPALAPRALQLLSRSGAQDLAGPIEAALPDAGPAARVLLCRAMGESEDPTYLLRLGPLAAAGEPAVRAAALVAELLLGSRPVEAIVRGLLTGKPDVLRSALLRELAVNSRSLTAQLLLEEQFENATGEERSVLGMALAREGVREARAWCREALLGEPPPAPEVARALVAALRARISSEDTTVLRRFFPREDTPENLALNIDLAVALCEINDPYAYPLLHDALWRGSFEVSLLAGVLLAQASGVHALRDEAANPPASARSTDMRRVGFALGTFGGLPEVEALAQLLRYNAGAPALQGVLLGFLSTRTQ